MTDSERVELNELCSAAVDGVLTDQDRERLQTFLRQSDEARRFYVRSMQLSASLHSYAAEMQSEPAEPSNVIQVPSWRWRPWAAAAAAVAAVALVFFSLRPRGVEDAVDLQDSVARLTGSKDCQWGGPLVLNPGDEVAAGQRVNLLSGAAELTFDSGAQLVVQGPAQLSVRSAWEAELLKGTVKANVPTEAVGFRVLNSSVDVVDLGTEFTMTATDEGTTEVFVLQGAVEVHPRDAKGQRQRKAVLREKQARRFAKAGPGEVQNPEVKFQQFMRKVAIDRLSKPLNYVRWSFDEGKGQVAAVNTSNQGASPMKLGPGAQWKAGRFGSALELDGTFTARAELMPPLRRGIRTMAFWTRIPAQSEEWDSGAFAAFPTIRPWGSPLELGWNRAPADGVIGALRFNAPIGSIVGSTPVHDGRWHHVAVVLGIPNKAGRPPLKLYVDGRLEPFSGKRLNSRAPELGQEDLALWIGGAPGSTEHFRGLMDELIVAEQPLTPQEIRHLMRSNTLLSPEAIAGL